MSEFCWREHPCVGAQLVSPLFGSPEEAGQWRRSHPPLIQDHGPAFQKLQDGVPVSLNRGDRIRCFAEFADCLEPVPVQLRFYEEGVK